MPDLKKLFDGAIEEDATIHSNSWGFKSFNTEQNPYTTGESDLVDQAMLTHKQLLIVWAAGNDGNKLSSHDPGGGNHSDNRFVRQIGGEAAAKNAITVGAIVNTRRIPNTNPGKCVCVDGDPKLRSEKPINAPKVWLGSSKGPTRELRLKPDVVAPGVGILSARSRALINGMEEKKDEKHPDYDPDYDPHELMGGHYWAEGKLPSRSFCFMSGTSQAAPLVASCAAILRQSLKSRPAKPSGALIKALLVNGATDLKGSPLKSPALDGKKVSVDKMLAAPNTAQGFGEVNLEQSLKCVHPES